MNRFYHFVFVALVALLTIVLLTFLLLFTDVSFSQAANYRGHLTNGNIWTAKTLRLSAELAYYNYWGDPTKDIQSRNDSVQLSADKNLVKHKDPDQKGYVSSVVNKKKIRRASTEEKFNITSTIPTTTPPSPETKTMSIALHSQFNEESSDPYAKHIDKFNRNGRAKKNATVMPESFNSTSFTETLNFNADLEQEEGEEIIDDYTENEDGNPISEEKEAEIIKELFSSEKEDQNSKNAEIEEPPLQKGTPTHNPDINPSLMARSTDTKFHMPCPKVYKPVKEIVKASWMKPLLQILSSFKGKQVTLVIANSAYRDVLLNWLISAKVASNPPLENIIVVCLDHILYQLLKSRDIPSIVAPFGSVLNAKHQFRRFFELIMMMRLGFMRLINRLGYDCAMYDIDAIILKNPQPLYDKWADVDIIGSRGELPRQLWRRWGVAICIGAVFIRSNERTELYWEAMHSAKVRGAAAMANDQIRLNYGLQALHIQWEHSKQDNIRLDLPALGHSSNTDLSVVVLPFSTICRFGCRANLRDKYYIWHKGGSRDKKSKMKGARQGRTWFLKDRWSEIHSNMIIGVKGTKWLKRISFHV